MSIDQVYVAGAMTGFPVSDQVSADNPAVGAGPTASFDELLARTAADTANSASDIGATAVATTPADQGMNLPAGTRFHFSVFLRVRSASGNLGTDVQSLFTSGARMVASTFAAAPTGTWTGDPVGSYLQASERTISQGRDQASTWLRDILAAGSRGFEDLAGSMGFSSLVNGGRALPVSAGVSADSLALAPAAAGFSMGDLASWMPWAGTNQVLGLTSAALGAKSTAAISSAATAVAAVSSRPLPRSPMGHSILRVSDLPPDSPAMKTPAGSHSDTPTGPQATTGIDTEPMRQFLHRFLDLVDSFLGGTGTGAAEPSQLPERMDVRMLWTVNFGSSSRGPAPRTSPPHGMAVTDDRGRPAETGEAASGADAVASAEEATERIRVDDDPEENMNTAGHSGSDIIPAAGQDQTQVI
jgi:hypothetical protein